MSCFLLPVENVKLIWKGFGYCADLNFSENVSAMTRDECARLCMEKHANIRYVEWRFDRCHCDAGQSDCNNWKNSTSWETWEIGMIFFVLKILFFILWSVQMVLSPTKTPTLTPTSYDLILPNFLFTVKFFRTPTSEPTISPSTSPSLTQTTFV